MDPFYEVFFWTEKTCGNIFLIPLDIISMLSRINVNKKCFAFLCKSCPTVRFNFIEDRDSRGICSFLSWPQKICYDVFLVCLFMHYAIVLTGCVLRFFGFILCVIMLLVQYGLFGGVGDCLPNREQIDKTQNFT